MKENKIISILTICAIAILFASPLILKNSDINTENANFSKTISYMNSHSIIQY